MKRQISWICVLAGGLAFGAYAQQGVLVAPAFDPHDLSGYWELPHFGAMKVPPAKLVPSVTPAMIDEHMRRDTHEIRWCNLIGTPAIMDSGRPLDIRIDAAEMVIAVETTAAPRHIYFNRPHISPDIFDPSTNGDSIARWEGDTLVVDTIGFHETHGLSTIPGGGFRTARSHLVERFKLLLNGAVLSVRSTWDDPKVFRIPQTYEFRYYRLPKTFEPAPSTPCDPYDEVRSAFIGDPWKLPSAKQ